jgi:hypothetical protein
MSDEGSDYEARILQLEREAVRLHRRLIPMETWRTRAIEEGLAMLRPTATRCTTTVSGTILGGGNLPLPFATVKFIGDTTGADYGTATADGSGDYTIDLQVDQADASIDGHVGPTPRMDDTVAGNTLGLPPGVRCGTPTLDPVGTPGADYTYMSTDPTDPVPTAFPLKKVMRGTDSVYGSPFDVTFDTISGPEWAACVAGIAYPGHASGPTCPSSTTALHYNVLWSGSDFVLTIQAPTLGSCPTFGSCITPSLTTFVTVFAGGVWIEPTFAGTKFSVTFTIPAGTLYPTGGTFTLAEP